MYSGSSHDTRAKLTLDRPSTDRGDSPRWPTGLCIDTVEADFLGTLIQMGVIR
jgi:hypothetical protein